MYKKGLENEGKQISMSKKIIRNSIGDMYNEVNSSLT